MPENQTITLEINRILDNKIPLKIFIKTYTWVRASNDQ